MKLSAPLLLGLLAIGGAGTAAFLLLTRDGGAAAGRSAPTSSLRSPTSSGEKSFAADPRTSADLATAEGGEEELLLPARTEAKAGKLPGARDRVRPAGWSDENERETLKGLLIDSYGNPVGGAAVEVEGTGDTGSDILPLLGLPSPKHETTSEQNGWFTVPRSNRWNEVTVTVKARGFLPFSEDRELVTEEGDEELGVFELDYGVVLAGTVVDPDGKPVEGAEVSRADGDEGFRAFGRSGNGEAVTTGADGRFELPHEEPGDYVLFVEHDAFPHGRFPGTTPPAGGESLSLVLALAPEAGIAGKIEGFPPGQERIRVVAEATDRRPGEEGEGFGAMLSEAGYSRDGLEGDVREDGTFEIRGLEAGRSYSVRAFARGGFFGRSPVTKEKIADAGDKDVRLSWDAGAKISFDVVDADTLGKVHDVTVRYRWETGGGGMPDSVKKRSFPAGVVRMDDLRPPKENSTLGILISAPGYLDLELDETVLSPGGKADLGNVRLTSAPKVRVHVVDAATGEAIEGAKVSLMPENEDGEEEDRSQAFFELTLRPSKGETDKEGWAELPACASATAHLKVTARGYTTLHRDQVVMPRSGTAEVVASMLEGARIRILVVDTHGNPVRDLEVEHNYPEGDGRETSTRETNKHGEIVLSTQPPGEHRFRPIEHASGRRRGGDDDEDDESWKKLMAANGTTAELTLTVAARGKLTGTVTAAGKPLERATVALLGIDEEPESDTVAEVRIQFGGNAGGSGGSDRTNARGRYELEDVPAGRYRMRISHEDRAMPHVVTVNVREGESVLDVALPLNVIEGRVVDEKGAGVPDANVHAEARREHSSKEALEIQSFARLFGGAESGAKTAADGSFRLEGVVEGVPIVVEAEAEGFQEGTSEEVTVGSGGTVSNVRVVLKAGGTLRVLVAGARPFTFVTASLEQKGENGEVLTEDVESGMIRDGEAVLKGLQPGTWRVRINDDDEEEEDVGTVVEVVAGEERSVELAP